MNKKRKEALVNKYMNINLTLTEYQKKWIRRKTAKHIFVNRDDECYCTSCCKTFSLGKTKHKELIKCPECGKKLEVIHEWRRYGTETINWVVIPKAINETTLMLRYVLILRHDRDETIAELARLITIPERKTIHTFELVNGNWEYSSRNYFAEYYMYHYRKICCLPADIYTPTFIREIKKLKGVKYIPTRSLQKYTKIQTYANALVAVLCRHAEFYEKLSKCGLQDFASEDIKKRVCYYPSGYRYEDNNSILKMLKINRNQFALFKTHQTFEELELIKTIPNCTEATLRLITETHTSKYELTEINRHGLNVEKTLKYFKKSDCNQREWLHYIEILKELDYTFDDTYAYPKNFRKEDERVAREYEEKMSELERERDKEKNVLIHNISTALQNNTAIREFFTGTNGLQIIVPESAEELRTEGRLLHNCLGTYVDRYAEGKTLIFFIRRIEDPTAAYIAMEYCNGKIIQCRYDHNVAVEDSNIINFANALAERLAKENILAA